MAVSHQTGRARSGEVTIHYRKLGRRGAAPLLIVHGLSYFSYDWLEVAHALGTGRGAGGASSRRSPSCSRWCCFTSCSVPSSRK